MLEFDDVRAAAAVLDGVAHRTPVLRSRTLDAHTGARAHLKAEHLQRSGAFKFRGAYTAISALEDRARGVVAVSSGNHAGAVALAARELGARATILMPADAPVLKRRATEGYGAEVVEFDRWTQDREALLAQLAADRDLAVVHPFDDPRVMAGQGTAALELFEDAGVLDLLLVPISGGGLAAGCSTVAAALAPGCEVVGVEPAAGDDVRRSLEAGERLTIEVPRTICDGLQNTAAGRLTFPVLQERVARVVTVTDAQVVDAMRFAAERLKQWLEPSGACALAALLSGAVDARGARVGVLLSGGNVGVERFAELTTQH
ncbi:MAG TPA: pyridoxal-phosphate dependent enzyme [Baekduia sp.]|nr:pyridoxal-phosphate dependent enzyme [Baekduia sp.]